MKNTVLNNFLILLQLLFPCSNSLLLNERIKIHCVSLCQLVGCILKSEAMRQQLPLKEMINAFPYITKKIEDLAKREALSSSETLKFKKSYLADVAQHL